MEKDMLYLQQNRKKENNLIGACNKLKRRKAETLYRLSTGQISPLFLFGYLDQFFSLQKVIALQVSNKKESRLGLTLKPVPEEKCSSINRYMAYKKQNVSGSSTIQTPDKSKHSLSYVRYSSNLSFIYLISLTSRDMPGIGVNFN